MNAAKKYGIAIIANDRVSAWLLPFLESYLATNSATPLYLIPYDDNVELTRRAADVYGINYVEPDSLALDELARQLYPMFPAHRRRLRKFLSLALPLDEVIYLDVDIVLFQDFSRFFGLLEPGRRDFIISAGTTEYVYNGKHKKYDFLKNATSFNDGFFLTSKSILSLQDFYDVIAKDEAIFHEVRQRGMLFAQPLTNFIIHRRGLKLSPMFDCFSDVSGESYYKARGVKFDAGGRPFDHAGNSIYFAHWAGAVRLPERSGFLHGRRVFDAAWRAYARKAEARMKL
jgi:Glycosyl transferase family 8